MNTASTGSFLQDITPLAADACHVIAGTRTATGCTFHTRGILSMTPPLFTLIAATLFIAPAVGTSALLACAIGIQAKTSHTPGTTTQILVAIPAVVNLAREAPSILIAKPTIAAAKLTLDGLRVCHVDSSGIQRHRIQLAIATVVRTRIATSTVKVGAFHTPAGVTEVGSRKFAGVTK